MSSSSILERILAFAIFCPKWSFLVRLNFSPSGRSWKLGQFVSCVIYALNKQLAQWLKYKLNFALQSWSSDVIPELLSWVSSECSKTWQHPVSHLRSGSVCLSCSCVIVWLVCVSHSKLCPPWEEGLFLPCHHRLSNSEHSAWLSDRYSVDRLWVDV